MKQQFSKSFYKVYLTLVKDICRFGEILEGNKKSNDYKLGDSEMWEMGIFLLDILKSFNVL